MCGIAGIFRYRKSSFDLKSNTLRMAYAISHRGPNASGAWNNDFISLAHTRLSILDLSETANQPFKSNCGNFVLVFNGEIYNYKNIRQELIDHGYEFQTNSDTEVLLNCIIHYGISGISKLVGMFAFALYNVKENSILLVRDRFGEKPLYYFHDRYNFAFCSEFEPIARVFKPYTRLSTKGIMGYIQHGYFSGDTLYENIKKLPPGTYAKVNHNGEMTIETYWDAEEHCRSRQQYDYDKFIYKLQCAVSNCLMSDVPVGIFLSGGIDSTVVAALASKSSVNNVTAYTFNSTDVGYSEHYSAIRTARQLGIELKVVKYDVTRLSYLSILDRASRSFLADTSFIPTSILANYAAQENRVILGGDGADELLLGYETYKATQLAKFLGLISPKVLSLCSLFFESHNKLFRPSESVSLSEKIIRLLRITSADPFISHSNWRVICDLKLLDRNPRNIDYIKLKKLEANIGFYNVLSLIDIKGWLDNDILHKVDSALMYESVEGRAPFLDVNFAEYALGLSSASKRRWGIGKLPLRRYLNERGLSHVTKKKRGFGFPLRNLIYKDAVEFFGDNIHTSFIGSILEPMGIHSISLNNASDLDLRFIYALALLNNGHEKLNAL